MPIDPSTAWAWLLAAASAVVLLSHAADKIGKGIAAARKPNEDQNAAIRGLEGRMDAVERKLATDKDRLDAYEDGMRVSQQALLALLDHSIDGNNVDQMRAAKIAIQKHLLNK